MRPWTCLALLLATLALPAAADGNLSHEYVTRTPYPIAYTPQIQCDFAFVNGGEEQCDLRGYVSQITHVHARVVGQASVFVRLDLVHEGTPEKLEQLALLKCNGAQVTCKVPIVDLDGRKFFYGKVKMAAYAEGEPGAYVSAFIERRGDYDLP